MLRAVTYIRMSTQGQDTSPEQQRSELLGRFGGNYEIIGEYLDYGKSGSKDVEKRTDFMRLLADSGKGEFTVVLCYDLSRFSRLDSIEGGFAKKILRDNGICLVTILEGEIDWNSSTGRIVDSVLSEAQHDYSVRLANKCLLGKLAAAQKGKTYGQCTPYGLARLVTEPQGSQRIVPRTERFRKPKDWSQVFIAGDESEVTMVRWLYSEFRRRDVSFHQLAKELNERGIPSPRGGMWCYQTVIEILVNVRYVGDLSLGKDGAGKFYRLDGDKVVRNTDKTMKTNKTNRLIFSNTHKGIIEREEFDEVQVKVKRRWRSGKHACREDGFALGGVLYCGGCGKPLYGNDGTKRAKVRDGVRYVCKGIHRRPDSKCGQWGIHQDEILPFLIRVLLEQIDSQVLRRADTPMPQPVCRDTSRLEKRFAKLMADYKTGLRRFLSLPDDMKLVAGDIDDELKNQKMEIDRLEHEISESKGGEDPWREVLRQRKQWWEAFRDKLTYIPTVQAQVGTRRYSAGVRLSVSAMREMFHQIDCRMTLWWERVSKNRFRIARGRLQAGNKQEEFDAAQFDRLR